MDRAGRLRAGIEGAVSLPGSKVANDETRRRYEQSRPSVK